MLRLSQIFLQADTLVVNFFCSRLSHVPVMPWYIADAGDLCLVWGIPLYKSVLPAILIQPLVNLIPIRMDAVRIDIHRKAQLVFAGSRHSNPVERFLLCSFMTVYLREQFLNFLVHISLLIVIVTIA